MRGLARGEETEADEIVISMPASANVNEAEQGKDCCQRGGLDPEGVASDSVQDMHSWAVRMQRAMTKRQEGLWVPQLCDLDGSATGKRHFSKLHPIEKSVIK